MGKTSSVKHHQVKVPEWNPTKEYTWPLALKWARKLRNKIIETKGKTFFRVTRHGSTGQDTDYTFEPLEG